jgi:hypothetical protein
VHATGSSIICVLGVGVSLVRPHADQRDTIFLLLNRIFHNIEC